MPDPRNHLLQALEADLIGPYNPETGEEVLKLPPLRWYLTGFLIPEGGGSQDPAEAEDESEDIEAGDFPASDDAGAHEPAAKQRPVLPSSMGLTLLVPEPTKGDTLRVGVSWGQYAAHTTKDQVEALCHRYGMDPSEYLSSGSGQSTMWSRVPVPEKTVDLDLAAADTGELMSLAVPDSGGVTVEYRVERIPEESAAALRIGEPGQSACAVSIFLVNGRSVAVDREKNRRGYAEELNRQTLFQVGMSVRAKKPLLPRPDAHFGSSSDFDDQMVDLQFRKEVEWAVGHGISAAPIGRNDDLPVALETNPAIGARATWLPRATVAKVKPGETEGVEVGMKALSKLASSDDVDAALAALLPAYASWISEQSAIELSEPGHRKTQARLVEHAKEALGRIRRGIDLLRTDLEVRQAFCWANEAMNEVAVRRIGKGKTDFVAQWRLFQLAFLLLNLEGIADPTHADRRSVELLFFPTGGGKTEAYLGVIATTLLLRRMRGHDRPDEGLGVSVILRYTLRLLTLDQLDRASALVCSLELVRRAHEDRLGTRRYSIGLWVGRSGSPNTLADAKKDIQAYRGRTAESKGSPFPLVKCPWCDTPIEGRGMDTLPRAKKNPTRTVVVCANRDCEFSGTRRGEEGSKVGELPVLFVDEHIYAELPSFLVSTVDKFAMLTHRGQAGKLFGRVHSCTDQKGQPRRFWGGGDGEDYVVPGASAEPLQDGLPPPDLIVQDELHLISGPLGTMVGLFETLVEDLCSRPRAGGPPTGPKIIAATATVRRANRQVQALYARDPEDTKLFPPQGVDAWETFFAERDTNANERMYVGVAAAGRSMKRNLLTSYLAMLGAAEWLYSANGGSPQSADPYKTVVGYFNSLRELGGMRRLVDDEITRRVRRAGERRPHDARALAGRWFANRTIGDPIELTSRVKTSELTRDKARLETRFDEYHEAKRAKTLARDALKPVDVLLASNMISVGVDIDRLGLMIVAGQPKTTAEYIQASSRVGRDDKRPGLVMTVYNMHKPRDRSHYEHFTAYHESFYRYVEAQSVTPFSLPALFRSLASVVVGLVRHGGRPQLAAPRGAERWKLFSEDVSRVGDILHQRAAAQPGASPNGPSQVSHRGKVLIDKWRKIVGPNVDSAGSASAYCYSPYESRKASAKALTRTPEDDARLDGDDRFSPSDPEFEFVAPTSLRDVEPSVAIWVRRRRPQEGS